MKKMSVSLIIPAFNEEKSIRQCIEAALHSSEGNFLEILVIDNNSTDKTKEVAKSCGVKVITETQQGVTVARQRGFLEAEGDLLAFIDADTLMNKEWFDSIEKEFARDENIALLSGPYYYYDIPPWKQTFIMVYWYVLALPIYYIIGYMAVGGNMVIKKATLAKMNGFDTTIIFYGDDTDTARRAKQFGKVIFTSRFMLPSSGRRLNNQGICSTLTAYVMNFLSEVLLHKPLTKKHQDFR